MRTYLILASATTLAACGGGGGGAESVGSVAPPAAAGPAHSFVAPTESKTYQASSTLQTYEYDYVERVRYAKTAQVDAAGNPILDDRGNPTFAVDNNTRTLVATGQRGQLYTGNASTVRNPGVTVTYDPRNAQFTMVIAQNGVTENITFQDPAHRTDFSGARTPQLGVPNLETGDVATRRERGVQYLQVDSGSTADGTYDVSTFFYEKPGTTTKYVTYAGFVRNHFGAEVETIIDDQARSRVSDIVSDTRLERSAFIFGEQTANSAVPRSGTATFNGNMIASMVNTPQLDTNPGQPSYFQWLSGSAQMAVDFAASTVTATLTGTTLAPMRDPTPLTSPTNTAGYTYPTVAIPAGASFTASAGGRIDLAGTGGFVGNFTSARFTAPGVASSVAIAGSTLDGAFYGPGAAEVGATFRIVGGIPDQRVDIIGSFTAAK